MHAKTLQSVSGCWHTSTPVRIRRKPHFQGKGKWYPSASDQRSPHSCFGEAPLLPAWHSEKHAASTGRLGPSPLLLDSFGCRWNRDDALVKVWSCYIEATSCLKPWRDGLAVLFICNSFFEILMKPFWCVTWMQPVWKFDNTVLRVCNQSESLTTQFSCDVDITGHVKSWYRW